MAAYCCSSLLRTPLPWLAALVSLLAAAHSLEFEFLTVLLTSSALILCPLIVCRSIRHQQKLSQTATEEKEEEEDDDELRAQKLEKRGDFDTQKEPEKGELQLLSTTSDSVSDSESASLDHTTSSDQSNQSTNWSDGSISDEESLIEIALPTGHYVEDSKGFVFHQKWLDCSLEMMNEENFIEFDICMGSIKCSRFEIEA